MYCLTHHYKRVIIPIISRYIPHATIILYGSRARFHNRASAGLDIALDAGGCIEKSILESIKKALVLSPLRVKCTVVDLHAVSETIQQEIKHDGVIWKQ